LTCFGDKSLSSFVSNCLTFAIDLYLCITNSLAYMIF
jgi:hypothetical protein